VKAHLPGVLSAAAACAAGLAIVSVRDQPAAAIIVFIAATILEALPGRPDREFALSLSPVAIASLTALCGIPRALAAGAAAMVAAGLIPQKPSGNRVRPLHRILRTVPSLLPAALVMLAREGAIGPEAAAVIVLWLVIGGRLAADMLAMPAGERPRAFQWLPGGAMMTMAVLLLLAAIRLSGAPGAFLLLVPLVSFASISVIRERKLASYRQKTTDLAVQNLLASELASSRSTTDFLGLVSGYLSPSTQSAVTLLTRQESGSEWVGWSSSEQRTFERFPSDVEPPGWNEIRFPAGFLGKEGVLVGLTPSSDMLLFADGPAGRALRYMRPDVRGNLVSLLAHAWLAVGRTLTIDGAFIAAAMILARLADSKDDYTHGHSIRVARLSTSLGRHLGLSGQRLRTLRVGALLHDLGKVAVPAEILTKRGLLTRDERNVIERHPVEGTGILGSLRGYEEVRDIVRCHHERLDGKGYPSGISGRRIPFLARIVAVADTFDAITSSRSYRADADPETALAAIRAGSGTQFDARVVGALEEMMAADDEAV
jgi:putative nucleotidyltransferase with HDIG domain